MKTGFVSRQTDFDDTYDLICFSHLRWDFVYQRPQHLLCRFAAERRVFFIEEPIFYDGKAFLKISQRENELFVAVPHIPHNTKADELGNLLRVLLDDLLIDNDITDHISWYYTPMMLGWSDHLHPLAVVYDCMDELSAFKNAPPELHALEAKLFSIADLVFTGGHSLFEAKRNKHDAVYPFPSSIDAAHFARALKVEKDPSDQANIPAPRVGFFGVIDERCDIKLLEKIADLKPEWHFVMIGPVVKIDEADLPRSANIHYLGGKSYNELPDYIAGWDVAMMPFAVNESTRFISPTKTPEYLAAGKPVVSTPIRDVIRPYGDKGLVFIAKTPEDFISAIGRAMNEIDTESGTLRRKRADEYIEGMSWDKTFTEMLKLINLAVARSTQTETVARG